MKIKLGCIYEGLGCSILGANNYSYNNILIKIIREPIPVDESLEFPIKVLCSDRDFWKGINGVTLSTNEDREAEAFTEVCLEDLPLYVGWPYVSHDFTALLEESKLTTVSKEPSNAII